MITFADEHSTALAPRAAAPLPTGLAKRLSVEVRRPVLDSFPFYQLRGIDVEPLADPVLVRRLGQYDDHREYQAMNRDPSVAEAWRHVETEILNEGFEIQIGPSRTPAAQRLERFAQFLWSRIPIEQRRVLIMRSLDAAKWGWQPFQVLPDFKAKFEGADVWLPRRVVEKPVWHFRWGLQDDDGRRPLIFLPNQAATEPVVYDPDAVRLGWLTPSYGSTNIPYGDEYVYSRVWLLWQALKIIRQSFFQGMPRSFGLLQVTRRQGAASAPTASGGVDWDQVTDDIQQIIDVYNSLNVAVEVGDYQLQVLANLNFIEAGDQAVTSLERSIRLGIVGETLTSDVGDSGSRALGTVHAGVRSDYAGAIAGSTAEPMVSGLFEVYSRANFGDVDPDDLPTLVSRIRLKVDLGAVRQIWEMGGRVRVGRLTELIGPGMSSVIATDPANPDEVLEKPAGVDFGSLFFGQDKGANTTNGGKGAPPANKDGQDEEDDALETEPAVKAALAVLAASQRVQRDRGRTVLEARRAADTGRRASIDRQLGEAVDDAMAAGEDAESAYVRSLAAAYTRGRDADPKATPRL